MDYLHIPRQFKAPEQSYFLFGTRGTGKSTLVEKRYPDGLLLNLLLPNLRRQFQAQPERLLELVRAQPNGKTIIIDEIQKIPELLSLIHILIEEKKQWKFILTGSSSRKLKRAGVDLLGGRVLKKTLHPFLAAELKSAFSLEDAIKVGLLPLRYASPNPIETLSAYVTLYLEEEIKAEGIVRDIEPFARFLETLSFSHGSILNLSSIARECSVKRSTADNWLSIVEDLLIAYRINVFSRRAKRVLSAQSKFYFIDSGIYQVLRSKSVLDKVSEIDGAALEGLVAQHLRAWVDYTQKQHRLYFWRTKSGLEVDFILHGELGFWAIEVKHSAHVHPKDLKGLKSFKEDYPEANTILLHRGSELFVKNDVFCCPVELFLQKLVPNEILFFG